MGRSTEQAGLWQDRSFRILWASQTAAVAGGQIRYVVLPILMFQLTGSPALTAFATTIQAGPYLLFGLVAGAIVDRSNRRVVMIVANFICATSMASIPLAASLAELTPTHLFIAAGVAGIAFVWQDAALFGVVPAIATRERVADAYGILVSTEQMLRVVTTAAAGVLVTATGAENALWIDAAGYVISAGLIAFVPRSLRAVVPEGHHRARVLDDIVEGLKYVRRHPVIWPLTVTGLGVGLVSGAVNGLIVVYGVRQLDLGSDDARLAWLFTALALGGLLGGLALPVLSWRLNPVLITLASLAAAIALLLGIALQGRFIAALLLLTGWGSTSTLIVYNGIRLRQQLSPDRLQGRVNLTARMITIGSIPLGAVVAGTLAGELGVGNALLSMTVLLVGTAAYAWTSPLRRLDRDQLTRLQAAAEVH